MFIRIFLFYLIRVGIKISVLCISFTIGNYKSVIMAKIVNAKVFNYKLILFFKIKFQVENIYFFFTGLC